MVDIISYRVSGHFGHVGETFEEEGEEKQQEAGVEQEVRMQLKGRVRGEGGLWVINAPNTAENPLTHMHAHTHTDNFFFIVFSSPFCPLLYFRVLVFQ